MELYAKSTVASDKNELIHDFSPYRWAERLSLAVIY